jgi:hypothetical protein
MTLFICTDTFTNIYSSEVPRALIEWRRALRVGGMLLLNAYTLDDDTQNMYSVQYLPAAKGISNNAANLITACYDCNLENLNSTA